MWLLLYIAGVELCVFSFDIDSVCCVVFIVTSQTSMSVYVMCLRITAVHTFTHLLPVLSWRFHLPLVSSHHLFIFFFTRSLIAGCVYYVCLQMCHMSSSRHAYYFTRYRDFNDGLCDTAKADNNGVGRCDREGDVRR